MKVPNDQQQAKDAGTPQQAFEGSLRRILSLPKDKIDAYNKELKPFPKSRKDKPPK